MLYLTCCMRCIKYWHDSAVFECSIDKQVMVLGSYSNSLPGQDSSSGASLPRYRVSEGSTFGSMPDVEWQQLEVRSVLALQRFTLPMMPRCLASTGADVHK